MSSTKTHIKPKYHRSHVRKQKQESGARLKPPSEITREVFTESQWETWMCYDTVIGASGPTDLRALYFDNRRLWP